MNSETSITLNTIRDMKEFYQNMGLHDYPFNVYTAENEIQYATEIFVHPYNYDAIKSSFDGNRSIVVRGNRGTGKTALLNDLYQSTNENECIKCVIDDYSEMPLTPATSDYYELLIQNLVAALFYQLFSDKQRIRELDKEERVFLSCLLSEYTSQPTKTELKRKIEAIQLSGFARFIKRNFDLCRAILNFGITAGLNVVNDVIRNYFGVLPPIQESQIKDIIPKTALEADTEFNKSKATYNLLMKLCLTIKKLGYRRIVVFFDKFDEDSRMENNAETISDFFTPLLTDNKLLENPNIQLVISVWEVPFNRILSQFRSQKHHCPLLSWPLTKLKDALNKRLFVFSNGAISSYRSLFADDVDDEKIAEIFELCNGNPRDLWHIFDLIIQEQYSIDPANGKLTVLAINRGLNNFVTSFNFYEYYPKKPKAKANTMDIYSYIKHLLKLDEVTFTKNQLSKAASTGSSTPNYVVGMEGIGLVTNTKEKLNGGVVYRINDPKIVYAMKNHLDISR